MSGFHRAWAWVVIVGNGAAGLWALGAMRWAWARRRQLWWFTAAVQLSTFVQVGVGVAMVSGRDTSALRFHMFYGFLTIISVGIIYSYRQQLRDRLYLLYGLGGLFIMGLGIRAWQVGPR
ncbi:MAG: hypothetical protein M3326_08590 [Actinomycetota bacterium]|nr:hypothetical protein [Actinomycetota bacterium]